MSSKSRARVIKPKGLKPQSSKRALPKVKSAAGSVKKSQSKSVKSLYAFRLKSVRNKIKECKLQALLVTDLKSVRYLTGFTGSSAFVVVTLRSGALLTDPRYTEQAAKEVQGLKVRIYKKDPLSSLADLIKRDLFKGNTDKRVLGFESEHLRYSTYFKLRSLLRPVKLKSTVGLMLGVRSRKDSLELGLLKESAGLLGRGFHLAATLLSAGVVESEAAWKIESFFRSSGAEGLAFDTIVASGFRGALPHGVGNWPRR